MRSRRWGAIDWRSPYSADFHPLGASGTTHAPSIVRWLSVPQTVAEIFEQTAKAARGAEALGPLARVAIHQLQNNPEAARARSPGSTEKVAPA